MPKPIRKPSYLLHKPTGQARCRIDGRDHYLGLYGTPESREAYDELIHEWLAQQDASRCRLTVDDLVVLFLDWAETYYRHRDGTPTGAVGNLRHALRFLVETCGRMRIRDFGPLALKQVRQAMIDAGLCRTNINRQVHRIKRVFSWAVENELVAPEVLTALRAVPALRAGRSEACESEPVRPVDDATVERTLAHLPRVVADMVRLQLLTGARPGEICAMRPRDVERGGKVWTYRPASHKTQHHGKERRIYIGPEGQRVLAPYLLRDADSFCFQPAESEEKRNSARKEQRRSAMTPSQASRKPKGRELRDHYTKDSYNRAVARGCEAAFGMPAELRNVARTVARMTDASAAERAEVKQQRNAQAAAWRRANCWSPNQLRHTAATRLEAEYDLQTAACILGHSDPSTTRIYAQRDFDKAAAVMLEIG